MPRDLHSIATPAANRLAPLCGRPAPAAVVIGSGWLESSWDLRRGLVVSEGWPHDASLAHWLDAFFRGAGDAAQSL